MKRFGPATAVLAFGPLLAACASRDDAAREMEGAAAFIEGIPVALTASGPRGWLDLFEETEAFFMASDGAMAFPGRDSAQLFLDDFAPTVVGMGLVWEDVRLEPLAPGLASFAIPYRERITLTDSSVAAFAGFVTGVVRRGDQGWRIQHLHWSSPPGN